MKRGNIAGDNPNVDVAFVPEQDDGMGGTEQVWEPKATLLRIPRVIRFFYDSWDFTPNAGAGGRTPFDGPGGDYTLKTNQTTAIKYYKYFGKLNNLANSGNSDPINQAICDAASYITVDFAPANPSDGNGFGAYVTGGSFNQTAQEVIDLFGYNTLCEQYMYPTALVPIHTRFFVHRRWCNSFGRCYNEDYQYVDTPGVAPGGTPDYAQPVGQPKKDPNAATVSAKTNWKEAIDTLSLKFDGKTNFFFQSSQKVDFNIPTLINTESVDGFFGCKVLNLVILSYDYGFDNATGDFEWDQDAIDESVQAYKDNYDYFAQTETHIWMDFGFAAAVDKAVPDRNMSTNMAQTETKVKAFCTALKDYGFYYDGRIDYNDPNTSSFEDRIKKFYNLKNEL